MPKSKVHNKEMYLQILSGVVEFLIYIKETKFTEGKLISVYVRVYTGMCGTGKVLLCSSVQQLVVSATFMRYCCVYLDSTCCYKPFSVFLFDM